MNNKLRNMMIGIGILSSINSYAMPATINEIANIKEASCGGDACYISMSFEKVDNVSIAAFCSEDIYCPKYIKEMEKNNTEEIKIDKRAKVELSLVANPFSGGKMYSLKKMTFLKD